MEPWSSRKEEENEAVILELRSCEESTLVVEEKDICLSTEEISSWDIPLIPACQFVKIRANRSRLIQQSSFFRCLFEGNFSESGLNHVSIQWSRETVIMVLQFIYGCQLDITPVHFLPVLEAALFFGVETLLWHCEAWFRQTMSASRMSSLQIPLDALIEIWNFGLEHAISFIPELCKGYLAQNFVLAVSCDSFIDVPYDLLCSTVEHPHLTVDSEKQLCEALLVWVTNNGGSSQSSSGGIGDCYTDILKEVRICLLPLSFVAGKRRTCYLSKLADESVTAIFDLIKNQYLSPLSWIRDDVFDNFRIRITEYSERIDLSGCVQITSTFLLLSLISSSCKMDTSLRKRVHESLIEFENPKQNLYPISQELLPMLSFDSVKELDISRCPRLYLTALFKFMNISFPSLRILKASHCFHLKMRTLLSIVQKCPQINDIDLTVDISPVIPTQVSVISTTTEECQDSVIAPYEIFKERSLLSNIAKLTLEGRTDIDDLDLKIISALSSSLSYLNLKGCTKITDVGISQLIRKCMNLHSLVVSYTEFGRNSVLALCSNFPNLSGLPDTYQDRKHSSTLAFQLQQLHLCGCKSINLASLSHLICHVYWLQSLSLRETSLVDDTLFGFVGSSLEYLDVSDTMVSRTSLTNIIRRNPGLKFLRARGCRNLHDYKNDHEMSKFSTNIVPNSRRYNEEELFHELSQRCTLKEIEFGWGFSPFSMEVLRPSIITLKAVTFGLGASLGEHALNILSEASPLLEEVVLNCQVVSDNVLRCIITSLRNLRVLGLCYCLGNLTSLSFQMSMPNLRTLKLERVTRWMTNDDLVTLTRNCTSLCELLLTGCALLDSESQHIISSGWSGLRSIRLEDCGQVTSSGVSSLLECKALEDLLLRHNGRGIQRNFIADAASKLPLLRTVALDLCDAVEGGFESPSSPDRFFLTTVKIASCKTHKCAFQLPNSSR